MRDADGVAVREPEGVAVRAAEGVAVPVPERVGGRDADGVPERELGAGLDTAAVRASRHAPVMRSASARGCRRTGRRARAVR